MAFYIKRYDRLPYLPFQFVQSDGVTPLNVSSANKVSMVARLKGDDVDAAPRFKAVCTMTDAINGTGEYRWNAGDTDIPGEYEYEFEIEWPGPKLQTIPASSYLQLFILDDVG